MEYYDVFITTQNLEEQEIFAALLQQLHVDSLWETEKGIHAYFEKAKFTEDSLRVEVNNCLEQFSPKIDIKVLENVNWNKQWESNFDPVEIDQFCYIFAEFHKLKPGFEHYIKIAPKMAFGTGHHDTTYMMMKAMKSFDFNNKSVLDLGCGSGILSILAAKLGCNDIDAIDIELPSYENTIEHAEMNSVRINALHGGVEDVPNRKYDVVLANINRGVLTQFSKEIIGFLKVGSIILISGILEKDRAILENSYSDLKQIACEQRGKWLCFQYVKSHV